MADIDYTTSGIVTAPVVLVAVSKLLGTNIKDDKTLCLSGKINQWAKWKPVRHTSRTPLSSDTIKELNYGLSIPKFTNIGSPTTQGTLLYNLVNGTAEWSYLKPSEDYNSFYRLSDFVNPDAKDTEGYYHKAQNPIGEIGATDIYLNINGTFQIDWDAVVSDDDVMNIRYQDLNIDGVLLTEFYLAIAFVNGNKYIIASSTNKLGENDFHVQIENMSSMVGTWTIYPFLSSVRLAIDGEYGVGKYISANKGSEVITIHKAGSLHGIVIFGVWNSEHTQISYSLYMTNESGSEFTFSDITVFVYHGKNQEELDAQQTLSESYTVDEDSTRTEEGFTINITSYSSKNIYWIGATANGVSAEWMQIEEPDEPLED